MKNLFLYLLSTLFFSGCVPYRLKPIKICRQSSDIKGIKKAVIQVFTKNSKGKLVSVGSGFAVSKKGYFLTSAHVAFKNSRNWLLRSNGLFAKFKHNGKFVIRKAVPIARTYRHDIALVKVENHTFKSIIKRSRAKPRLGECVLIAGYGFGSDKLVRVYGNFYGYMNMVIEKYGTKTRAMVLTAHIINGISGGPVINKNGEYVGIANYSIRLTNKNVGPYPRFTGATRLRDSTMKMRKFYFYIHDNR